MAYKNQWRAFEDINNIQIKHLNDLSTLCDLFTELSQVEKNYSERLNKIVLMISSLNNCGSLAKIFEMFKQNIQNKKEHHLNLEQLARNLFAKDQLIMFEINRSRNQNLSRIEEKKFNEVVYQVKEAKKTYDKQMEEIEKDIVHAKEKNNAEEIEKVKQSCIIKEKFYKTSYCEKILEGNGNRDKYEKKINDLLKKCANHDQLYLEFCVNKFSIYFQREKEILKQLSNANEETYNLCRGINVANDLNEFSKNNHRHSQPPDCFDFEVYQIRNDYWSPQSDLSILKGYKLELRHLFKQNFSYYPPEGITNKVIVDKFKKLEERTAQAWTGKIDPEALKELAEALKDKRLASHYLKYAHLARVNQTPLKLEAYSAIVHSMIVILNASLIDQPHNYDYIYQIILLSQTFYMLIDETKPNEPSNQKFLQIEILKEDLWRRKDLWIGLVSYAFESEMRKENKTTDDTLAKRILKEHTTMVITLTTFKFIMDNYAVDKETIKEVINEYCAEFKINESIIKSNEDDTPTAINKTESIR